MKLWGVFRFEIAYQLRRVWPWLILVLLLVLSFMMARDMSLADAMYEDFFANSPFNVARSTVVGIALWLLLAPPVAGEAAARDLSTGMHPLVYTAALTKTEYLGGRFLAALALNALLLLAVQAGILLGAHSPGVDPAVLGPFRPAAYLTAFAYLALPTAFVGTAIQFALAERTGRAMAAFLGSVLLIFTGFFLATLLRFLVDYRLGMVLDPVGINFVIEDLAHSWTTAEKRSRLLSLEGTLLTNRLVWLGVGLLTSAAAYLRFRFAHRAEGGRWWWRRRRAAAPVPAGGAVTAIEAAAVPRALRSFGLAIQVRKTRAIASASFRSIVASWAGLAFLVAIPLVTVLVIVDQMHLMGTPLIPTTDRVLRHLTGGLSAELAAEPSRWVIVPLFVVFFAGELVWREREAGLGEITDAMPGSEWAPLAGKFLGLGLVLAVFMAMLAAAGMAAQAILGHTEFEPGLYVVTLFGLQLPEYLLFALLAVVIHVLVNQKYVGHVTAIMAYAFIAVLAAMLGIEHGLLVYGTGPGWAYTGMRGFGPTLGPWLWFKAYWAAWALLLAAAAALLWVRGRETGWHARIGAARRRLRGATLWTAGLAGALIAGLGGFIYYNTNVLNEYYSGEELDALRAEYERRYRAYEDAPQPALAGTSLRIEIRPRRRAVEITGTHRLMNRTGVPLDSIHVATAAGAVETGAITFDRSAAETLDDEERGYRIYRLERPLLPGDSLRMQFRVTVEPRGFGSRGAGQALAEGGTAFNAAAWVPLVGYQRSRELLTPGTRREHGLEPRPVLASLYGIEGREPAARGGGVEFEAIVGTGAGQVAVAPGALRRTWQEGDRRYFHYATSAPIGTEWAVFSAGYAVREAGWTGSGDTVAIRIHHDPARPAYVDHLLKSVRASLDYYTAQFGPYPYDHLTVVAHPGAPGTGAHADPSIISHGDGFAAWLPEDDPERLDLPFWVMAHEMAHQWTVPYALVEGLPFLAEGLANYFATQAVRASRGEAQARRVLAFMRRPYPFRPIRRGEPLLQAMDPYLSRRRGPFAMQALAGYMGTDRVNLAIRRLIRNHDAPGAPAATTLDLYRELQAVAPDSMQPLLRDLFEVNALWDLETERATAEKSDDGSWQVTLEVHARKVVYDSTGVVTEVPLDRWVPVGVFGAAAEGRHELSNELYAGMHRIRSGSQTITVTVADEPVLAGVDPHHLLDWEEAEGDDDNIEAVAAGS